MASKLKFVLQLSIDDVWLRKIVTDLWVENSVLSSIVKFKYTDYPIEEMMPAWKRNVEEQVRDQVQCLDLPLNLKRQAEKLVMPIGADILKWKVFNEHFIFQSRKRLNKRILKQIQWTCGGCVDYKKTAEKIVKLRSIDIVKRFEIASFYCLVKNLRSLWNQLPGEVKSSLLRGNPKRIEDMDLEYYWPYILEDRESELFSDKLKMSDLDFYMAALQYFASIGNKSATQYFYNKLKETQCSHWLFGVVMSIVNDIEVSKNQESSIEEPCGRVSDILCYLLARECFLPQRHFLENHPRGVLSCLLEWPWHDLFLNVADVLWTFPSKSLYLPVLSTIKNPGFYQYYPNLFQKFFVKTPYDFRKCFVSSECESCEYFSEFFIAEDKDSIEVVFKSIEPEDRVKIVSSFTFFDLLTHVLKKDKWNWAEFCFRKATESHEDREQVKLALSEFIIDDDTYTAKERRRTFQRITETLDEIDHEIFRANRILHIAEKGPMKRKRMFSQEDVNSKRQG